RLARQRPREGRRGDRGGVVGVRGAVVAGRGHVRGGRRSGRCGVDGDGQRPGGRAGAVGGAGRRGEDMASVDQRGRGDRPVPAGGSVGGGGQLAARAGDRGGEIAVGRQVVVGRVVGDDVGGARLDGDRRAQGRGLPTRLARARGEGHGPEQGARGRPEVPVPGV